LVGFVSKTADNSIESAIDSRTTQGAVMQRRQQSGFTLVELMITLAVAVILATLAIPSFVSFVEKSRLRGATDDLVALLNSSRAAAVKLQRDVNVSLGGSASGSWCAGASSAGSPASAGKNIPDAAACVCTTANACQVDGASSTVSSAGYSGVTLSSVQLSSTTGDGSVTFNSKTGALEPLSTAATVDLVSKTGKYSTRITVSPVGQSLVCVPAGKPTMIGYPSC